MLSVRIYNRGGWNRHLKERLGWNRHLKERLGLPNCLVPPRPVDLQTSRPNQNPRARWEWVERPRGRLLAFARVRVRGRLQARVRDVRASDALAGRVAFTGAARLDSTPSMIRSMAVPAKKAAPVSTDEPTKMTLPGCSSSV